jgi:hypothetical protein
MLSLPDHGSAKQAPAGHNELRIGDKKLVKCAAKERHVIFLCCYHKLTKLWALSEFQKRI